MVVFIVNPAAGAGKAKTAVPIIDREMRALGANFDFIETERPDDAERVARLVKNRDASAIVCVGGDGTLQEYAGLAIKLGLPLGIVPCGSANDLLYSIPGAKTRFRSFEETVKHYAGKIKEGSAVKIDAVSVNGERYFLNIGGTGIDINVLEDAIPMKKYFAGGAYFFSLVKNAFTYKSGEMTVSIDGARERGVFLLLAVCNGKYYGGRLQVAPPADVGDGMITLCVAKEMPRLKRIFMFPLVKPGWHGKLKEISYINCSVLELEFEGKKTINLDGNLLEYESPMRFEIVKGAVSLII